MKKMHLKISSARMAAILSRGDALTVYVTILRYDKSNNLLIEIYQTEAIVPNIALKCTG